MIWRSVTLVSMGLLGAWIGWSVSDRSIPYLYWDFKTLNEPAPGGTLLIEYKVRRDKMCSTIAYRQIIDGGGFLLAIPPSANFPHGVEPVGEERLATSVEIPQSAQPGHSTYRVTRAYQCNWVQTLFAWPILDGPHDFPFTIRQGG